MKKLLFLLICICIADAAFAQLDTSICLSFKRGNFTYTNDSAQLVHIKRKGRIQQETVPETGVVTRLKIKWLTACSYEITQVWSNSKALRKKNGSSTVVHITSAAKYSYVYSCDCKGNPGAGKAGTVYKVNSDPK